MQEKKTRRVRKKLFKEDPVLLGFQNKDKVCIDINNDIFIDDEEAIEEYLSPKAFVNFEMVGDQPNNLESLKNYLSQPYPNLLLKGNNLIALHSLKHRFSNQVKLIYIDPPYNTGNDSFNYNDRFNHSTWLTFMKNRLEIARELLRDDGVIFVQCDDNEQAYLKVLMDEIFGARRSKDGSQNNFVGCIVWLNKEGGGKSDSAHFRKKHEYILCYAKKKENLEIYPQGVKDIERYKLQDKHEATRGKYQLIKLDSGSLNWGKSLDYPITLEGITFYAGGDKEKWQDRQNGGASKKDWSWRWGKEKLEWGIQNDFIEIKQNKKGEWNIYTKQYLNCDSDGNILPRKLQPMAVIEKHSNTQSNRHMKALFGKNVFDYSKSEGLIQEILEISTKEGDLVLDFFAGSGTTLAVAHKMGRRWIGIEQMDYVESITKERLKKVIEGEQGGVSKAVEWNGGGEFVYAELMGLNQAFREKIEKAKESEIEGIYSEIREWAFLDYRTDGKIEKWGELTLEERKAALMGLLDSNMDYLPYSEIRDKSFGVSEADIELNGVILPIANTATLQALQDCKSKQDGDKTYHKFEDYLKDLENDK